MKLRFGTIGTGWITDEYIRGAIETNLWEVTAVYSRTEDSGKAFADKHGAKDHYVNLIEMAKSDKLDAVYVASPNYLHFEHCKLFLEHGKHVICEKPVSAHADDVRALQTIAEKNKLIFMEAIMFLHLPQRTILEEALLKVGTLSLVKIDFSQRSTKLDSYLAGILPNIFNPTLETGALMDLGVYCIYPVLALFGSPVSYQITVGTLPSGSDSSGVITMKYSDKLVTLTYSKIGQAVACSEFQGNLGTLYVNSISRLDGINFHPTSGDVQHLCDAEEKHTLMGYEAKAFHRFISNYEANTQEYLTCRKLSLLVSEFMEDARKEANILFPRDTSTAIVN